MSRPVIAMENETENAPENRPGAMVRASTFFGLMAEFGTTQIPLALVSDKYLGMSERQAKDKASLQELPIPAFRIGSQKSPWHVSAADLAQHIDACRDAASDRFAAGGSGVAA